MNYVLTLEESFGEYLKRQTEHSMYEFQTVIHSFQTWKKLTNWNENMNNISRKDITYWKKQWHKNICLEKQSFLYKFIHNMEIREYLQRRASTLNVSQLTPTSLYRECIYIISALILFYETNLKIVSSHNQTLTA